MYKVSLHGGHSGEFCGHARGTLRETIEAAVAFGYHTFGVSEHAPRFEERFLYDHEREMGYDIDRLHREFAAYVEEVTQLAEEFADRLTVLRGFEAEVIPTDRYVEVMQGYRDEHDFDFMVGSVHYVNETAVDGAKENFDAVVESVGGLEPFAVLYYKAVTKMVQELKPDVVGHLDLLRRNAPLDAPLEVPAIREAAFEALEAIRAQDAILDLNTAGYRKGLGGPYPAPWLVQAAHERGIGFCFGVDSHGPEEVGSGVEEAREYLLQNGVDKIRAITRDEDGQVVRRNYPL